MFYRVVLALLEEDSSFSRGEGIEEMQEIVLVVGFAYAVASTTLSPMGKLCSYRKVGGLRFVRVMGFGCSFYFTRKPVE